MRRIKPGAYTSFLVLNAFLGLVGWLFALYAGQWLFNNGNAFFTPIASIIPLPPPYNQSAFITFFIAYGLYFLFGSFIIVVFFSGKHRSEMKKLKKLRVK